MVRSLNKSSIPNSWKYDYLDKFTIRGSGHTPNKKKPEYYNGGIKWISLTDSSKLDKGYIYTTDKEISEEGIKNSSATLHPKETVVLSRDAGVGKSAVMAFPMCVSQHFMAWRCDNSGLMNSWFLYNWLQVLKPEFERQAIGSTIKTIGLPYFKKLKIAVPPIEEQNKIVQILSTWDKAITSTEQLIITAQQQKKALMQQLLTGKKRFAGFGEEWKFKRFEELFTIKNDKKTQIKSSDYLDSGNTPIVDQGKKLISGYTNNSLTYNDVPVIIFGDHTRILKWVNFTFSPGADGTQVIKSKSILDLQFGYYLLCNTNIPNLGYSRHMRELKEKDFKYPTDIIEQKKIASVLTSADQEVEILQQKLTHLKQEKKALMQQLLTGKRRVNINKDKNYVYA